MEEVKRTNTFVETKKTDEHLARVLQEKQALRHVIRRYNIAAVVLVTVTIGLAFLLPSLAPFIFGSFILLLFIQIGVTKKYAKLAENAKTIRILQSGGIQPTSRRRSAWKIQAGVAVRDVYFFLVVLFCSAYLLHAFFYPTHVSTFAQYLEQVRIGPLSGTALLWMIGLLLLFYSFLFITGILYSPEINLPEQINTGSKSPDKNEPALEEFWVRVKTFEDDEVYLQGHRFAQAGKQPLILFPGFFQNGFVYHLTDAISLARYLWSNDFDIWMIHPRGTAQSEGRRSKTSLDDFASNDIPAVINHVLQQTGAKPIFVGHSQGGIAAIISMMGAVKKNKSAVILSDSAMDERQKMLKGLVTIGSFLDFTFSKPSWLTNFVSGGATITIGKKRLRIIRSQTLLKLTARFTFVGAPVSFPLRRRLIQSFAFRAFYFPITLAFGFIAQRRLWEFLYHIPNVATPLRKTLFFKTMDGTFNGILEQYHLAVANKAMQSFDSSVNYSENYARLTLPVSMVAMELDTLADGVMMKQNMFDKISSEQKFFTFWEGVGHEDHFANTFYFPWVRDAIKKLC